MESRKGTIGAIAYLDVFKCPGVLFSPTVRMMIEIYVMRATRSIPRYKYPNPVSSPVLKRG